MAGCAVAVGVAVGRLAGVSAPAAAFEHAMVVRPQPSPGRRSGAVIAPF
jgi:hypothetical protein